MNKKYFRKLVTTGLVIVTLSGAVVPSVISNVTYASENNVHLKEKNSNNDYVSGYLDENGNIVIYEHVGMERGIFTTIAIWAGQRLLGYVVGKIIDGIVVEVTGKTGLEWVQIAIRELVGQRYTGPNKIITWGAFTCPGVVIDHSGLCG